jgi:hypothetical protein
MTKWGHRRFGGRWQEDSFFSEEKEAKGLFQ